MFPENTLMKGKKSHSMSCIALIIPASKFVNMVGNETSGNSSYTFESSQT